MARAEKLDLHRAHKGEYAAPKTPALVAVGPGTYLAIEGRGEPGGAEFTAKVAALYGTAFTIKMASKFAGRDYKVCHLEGLWWRPDGGGGLFDGPREQLCWRLLIRTPDFICPADLATATQALLAKGKGAEVTEVSLAPLNEGLCVQVLHMGPYATEPETIARMRQFAAEAGVSFAGVHHEIYLSDPRRVAPERLRTILRVPVRRN